MPPIVASAPGSTGKVSPVLFNALFSWSRVTPASTVASRSSALTRTTRFISRRSRQMPPRMALTWPSSEVPAPNGTTGICRRALMARIAATSSVECGKQTTSGAAGAWYDSPWLWCSRTAAASLAREPSSARSSRIADSTAASVAGVAIDNQYRPDREPDDERRAVVLAVALHDDRSAVQVHQVLDDGETEAEAAESPLATGVFLTKPVEHVRQEFRRDARARVADDDRGVAVGLLEPHFHTPVVRRELDRVRQQVPDDLLQAAGVAGDDAQAPVDKGFNADVLGVGGGRHRLDRLAHDLR